MTPLLPSEIEPGCFRLGTKMTADLAQRSPLSAEKSFTDLSGPALHNCVRSSETVISGKLSANHNEASLECQFSHQTRTFPCR